MLDVVDHRQRRGHHPIGDAGGEDSAVDDLLELVAILPLPRQIGIGHDIEHQVHRLEPDRVATHRPLQVDVPAEVRPVGAP